VRSIESIIQHGTTIAALPKGIGLDSGKIGLSESMGHGVASVYEVMIDCKPPGEHWTQMPRK
jgi:hypothetical protein